MTRFILICPTKDCSLDTEKLVKSLIVQSHKEWLMLIVDGSTEKEELRKMEEIANSDSRIDLIKEVKDNPGIYSSMNQGCMAIAKFAEETDWIGFWGSDDWASDSDAFKRLSDFIEDNKMNLIGVNILVNKGKYVNKKTQMEGRSAHYSRFERLRRPKTLLNDMKWGKCPPHQCSLISKELLGNGAIFDTSLELAADLDFFLRQSCKGASVANTGIDIVRIQNGGVSHRKVRLRTREVARVYKKHLSRHWIITMIARYARRLSHFFD